MSSAGAGRNRRTYMLRRGDLELANGERHGPVDSKLVLLVAVGEASRLRRQLIEPACRNRVTHVAGSDRQELCRPNRDVNLCDGCLQFADVEPVDFEIDLFLHRGVQHQPGRGREERATSIADIGAQEQWVRLRFPGQHTARRAKSHRPPKHFAPDTGPRCEPSHTISDDRIDR